MTAVARAHAATYRWPVGFAGFRADLTFQDGRAVFGGSLEVALRPGGPPKLEVALDGADRDQVQWVSRQLTRMVTHRQEAAFDKTVTVVEEPSEHPLGVLLRADDRFSTLFRVRGDWITEVTRHLPEAVNRVFHLRRVQAHDGRYLPAHLVSTRADPATGLIAAMDLIEDAYLEADGVMLPRSRSVISQSAQGIRTRIVYLLEVAK